MPTRPFIRAALTWTLAAILPLFAVIPALVNPIEDYAMDTAAFHIYRTVVFSEARADGAGILPRWTQPTNGGLGGPLFAYTPTLMYFLMEGFHTLGLDYVYTWRAVTALMLMIASVGMFGFGRALFRRADAAYLSAAAFVYAPTLLRDFFERGSPQSTGVALFPWVLWAVLRLMRRPSGVNFTLAAVAWGLLVFAHNLSALLLAPVIVMLVITDVWSASLSLSWTARRFRGGVVLLALAAGTLLVAFYVFPVAAEMDYIQLDNPKHTPHAYPPDNPSRFNEVVNLPSAMDTGLGNNTMGASLGPMQFCLGGFVIVTWPLTMLLFWRLNRKPHVRLMISRYHTALGLLITGLGVLSALVIWLQLESANEIWRTFSFLDVLQFRFRLLSLASLAGALALGGLAVLFVHLPFTRNRYPAEEDQPYILWFNPAILWHNSTDRPDKETATVTLTSTIIVIVLAILPLYPQYMHRYNTLAEGLTVEDVKLHTIQANTASLAAFNEYVPIWRHMPFTLDEMTRAADSPIANLSPGATMTQDMRTTTHWQIGIETPDAFTAAFHLLYYPGWEARIDGEKTAVRPAGENEIYANSGYLLLDIPAGSHTVTLDYVGTTAQRLGDWTSIITALVLAGMAFLWRHLIRTDSENPEEDTDSPSPSEGNKGYLLAIGAILLLAGIKTFWLDETKLLLHASTCESIYDVDHYPPVAFGPYRLCGYHLNETTFKPGYTLILDLYWQVDQSADRPATSFTHIVGERFNPQTGTPVWGERDHRTPGDHPTTDWTPGKLYRDTFRITIPAHTPPGTYQIEIGWTYWDDGARIPPAISAPDADVARSEWDSLLLAEITVR